MNLDAGVRYVSNESGEKSSASNDITSLVPCLAVKGTNLMISHGFGALDGSGYEMADGFKCLNFTVAIS